MKKLTVIILFLFFFTPIAFSQEAADSSVKDFYSVEDLLLRESYSDEDSDSDIFGDIIEYHCKIGPEYAAFRYEEPDLGVKDEADLYGFSIELSGRSKTNPFLGFLEYRFLAGRVNYDGSLSDGTPFTDKGDDYSHEIRGFIGIDYEFLQTVFTPYFGMGYRYLNDDLESQYAYEREISYFYSPLGLKTKTVIFSTWSFGVNVEYDFFWSGTVKSHLEDVYPILDTLTNKQNNGFGARCSFYLEKEINEKFSFSIEPFFRYWEIDDSNISLITALGYYVVGSGYEPANSTEEYGIKINLAW